MPEGENGATKAAPPPSSFFPDDHELEYFSFSQLMTGSMVSPADDLATAREIGFTSRQSIASTHSPSFMMSPGISSTGFLGSPGTLFSPSSGLYEFPHQQPANSYSYGFLQPEYPTSQTQATTSSADFAAHMSSIHHQMPPISFDNAIFNSPNSFQFSRQHQPTTLIVDKPANDGYNWRKYGQKQVKGGEFPRSYYKCTYPKCPVKKKVERSHDGHITEIIYKGQHSHQRPPQSRRSKDGDIAQDCPGSSDTTSKRGASESLSGSSEGEEVDDTEAATDEGDSKPDTKRRNMDMGVKESTPHKTVTEPKIIVQTTSEIDLLDDGYRWRKYGQKVVKGNPHPRSYYKCTNVGCNVRKHIERASTDRKAVLTTYEGKHNHDVPAARSSSHNSTSLAAATSIVRPKAINPSSNNNQISISESDLRNAIQQPVIIHQMKEEKWIV
ncbi:probable WRKY transcription factor 4 [Typha latifolia]|uniref:probable WRKY transcription factor 4 n=1 Tax=Typha latifolia TaxID=4733 RepID=UPI003C2EA54A